MYLALEIHRTEPLIPCYMIISEWYLCKYGFRGESINERLLLDPEYGGDPLHVGMVGDVGCVQVVHHFPLVLDVPHVQQRSQNLATENINTRWHCCTFRLNRRRY